MSGRQFSMASLWLAADAVGAIVFAAGISGTITHLSDSPSALGAWVGAGVLGAGIRGLAQMLSIRSGALGAAKLKASLRKRLVSRLLAIPAWKRPPAGVLATVVVDEVEAMDPYYRRFLPARAVAGISPPLILLAIAAASPMAAAILMLGWLPFIGFMIIAGNLAAEESKRQLAALNTLSAQFSDRIRALPLILGCQAEDAQRAQVASSSEGVASRTIAVLRLAFLSSAGLEFFATLSVAMVAVYAGFSLPHLLPDYLSHSLTLGRAVFVLALAPEFYLPMRRLAAAYHDRQTAEAVADRAVKLEAAGIQGDQDGLQVGTAPHLSFKDVTIQYPGTDVPAVQDFSLEIRSGEMVALMGPSGSGKTSLLHLLLGMAPLSGGQILVDGVPMRPGALAGQVGWVGQDAVLTPGTVGENIGLSSPSADDKSVEAAADQVGINRSTLGRLAGDYGGGLSGGERRRISLARALLRQSPILLLDEPTAHLDPISEAILVQKIRAAAQGRTTIIATHSKALAAIANRVIRLEDF